jgi:nucleoside-diphosphate-sugar epimerase
MATESTVLVTGGSGFVASHCIIQLLEKGYKVRTTTRSQARFEDVRQMLVNGGVGKEKVATVEFVTAELTQDDGWEAACKDCDYVLHVASPFPASVPKNEDELIVPAREGALRCLKFAKAAGTVKRVVMTSSTAAVSGPITYSWFE